jgi:hypothetical protein
MILTIFDNQRVFIICEFYKIKIEIPMQFFMSCVKIYFFGDELTF